MVNKDYHQIFTPLTHDEWKRIRYMIDLGYVQTSELGKQKIRSVERRYLSHHPNSVKNCLPAQNFTTIMQTIDC